MKKIRKDFSQILKELIISPEVLSISDSTCIPYPNFTRNGEKFIRKLYNHRPDLFNCSSSNGTIQVQLNPMVPDTTFYSGVRSRALAAIALAQIIQISFLSHGIKEDLISLLNGMDSQSCPTSQMPPSKNLHRTAAQTCLYCRGLETRCVTLNFSEKISSSYHGEEQGQSSYCSVPYTKIWRAWIVLLELSVGCAIQLRDEVVVRCITKFHLTPTLSVADVAFTPSISCDGCRQWFTHLRDRLLRVRVAVAERLIKNALGCREIAKHVMTKRQWVTEPDLVVKLIQSGESGRRVYKYLLKPEIGQFVNNEVIEKALRSAHTAKAHLSSSPTSRKCLNRYFWEPGDVIALPDSAGHCFRVLQRNEDGHTSYVYQGLVIPEQDPAFANDDCISRRERAAHLRTCGLQELCRLARTLRLTLFALKVPRWPNDRSLLESIQHDVERNEDLRRFDIPRAVVYDYGVDYLMKRWVTGIRGDVWRREWAARGCPTNDAAFKTLISLIRFLSSKRIFVLNLKALNVVYVPRSAECGCISLSTSSSIMKDMCTSCYEKGIWVVLECGHIYEDLSEEYAFAQYLHTFDNR